MFFYIYAFTIFFNLYLNQSMPFEFKIKNIPFRREVKYEVTYRDIILPHYFYADFVCFDNIILEIKATNGFAEEFYKQTLNYMAIAQSPVGLLVNFGKDSLDYKRLVL